MKFSDVKPGMTVAINNHDAERWESFHEQFMRNPRYDGGEVWYNRLYKRYETTPITVTKVGTAPGNADDYAGLGSPTYKQFNGKTKFGVTSISEHWFDPSDENALRQVFPEMLESIKMAPAKRNKDIVMGELKALPGASDYNKAEGRFGKEGGRRKTRRRNRRTTRKH
jgi:hypothetical protein